MGQRVQRVKTEVSESQLAKALIDAWKSLFGSEPSKEQVAMLLSQNALETGNRKSMWNYNIGNITTVPNANYNYFDDLSTDEQIKPGTWKKMRLKYRAYDNLNDAAIDYLKFISSGRYANAWKSILNPDPVAYSKALKQSGYYTANEAPYTAGLKSLFNRFNKSDSYEKAKANSVDSVSSVPMVVNKSEKPIDKSSLMDKVTNFLNNISLANQEYTFLIKVGASDFIDGVEFARNLCFVLENKLGARAFTHVNEKNIEIECFTNGDFISDLKQIKALSNEFSSKFVLNSKNKSLNINTSSFFNKRSSYEQISIKSAEMNYRKYILKGQI